MENQVLVYLMMGIFCLVYFGICLIGIFTPQLAIRFNTWWIQHIWTDIDRHFFKQLGETRPIAPLVNGFKKREVVLIRIWSTLMLLGGIFWLYMMLIGKK